MILAGSLRRKVVLSAIAALAFVGLHEVTMDSPSLPARRAAAVDSLRPDPAAGVRLSFEATAYCKGLVTKAGVAAKSGVAASDPTVLPLGSIVKLHEPESRYDGIYTILDTGPAVQGREIDIYIWSCHEALRFGRRPVQLTVLRLGWTPGAATQALRIKNWELGLRNEEFPSP